LGQQLGVSLSLKVNRPQLYLSDQEKKWIDQIQHHVTDGRPVPFWLVSPYRAIFDDLLSKWRKDADR
jgi:hypothetical protein